jgi:endonuclease-3
VHRISNRLGIVSTKTPEQTELELSKLVDDQKLWIKINDTFVMYGQNVCLPVRPNCEVCNLKKFCDYYYKRYKNNNSDDEANWDSSS